MECKLISCRDLYILTNTKIGVLVVNVNRVDMYMFGLLCDKCHRPTPQSFSHTIVQVSSALFSLDIDSGPTKYNFVH